MDNNNNNESREHYRKRMEERIQRDVNERKRTTDVKIVCDEKKNNRHPIINCQKSITTERQIGCAR